MALNDSVLDRITLDREVAAQIKAGAVSDGAFAIAYSNLIIAAQLHDLAVVLDDIGLRRGSPSGPPGALEKVAMELERIASALESRE